MPGTSSLVRTTWPSQVSVASMRASALASSNAVISTGSLSSNVLPSRSSAETPTHQRGAGAYAVA